MANTKVSSNIRNTIYNGKHPLLPPKCPFPSISPSYVDYIPNPAIGAKGIGKPRERNSHHQRTSSESLLMEEQPSWLDELLDEPETPVRRGHRRSSSDSFAYLDASNASNTDYAAPDECKFKNIPSVPKWGSPDFDNYRDAWHASFYAEPNSGGKQKNRPWGSSFNSSTHVNGLPPASDKVIHSLGLSSMPQETDGVTSTSSGKQDPVESGPRDPKAALERKECSPAKSSASDTDSKRAKQQFAQRSRVRKLQYIAELERHVQALQAEGSEVSAELEFLNQQSLILSMENKALKQRLESLSQEQLIKCLEHEMLEREIGRLRTLCQQHQQHHPPNHRRTNSRELDSQFANLSLRHKDASSGRDPVSGQVRMNI